LGSVAMFVEGKGLLFVCVRENDFAKEGV
jgi:hypothetical protein